MLLLCCSKHNDAIHLTYCQNLNDTIVSQDSNGLVHYKPTTTKGGLQDPCFKDSLGDTILIKWIITTNDNILIELLNQNENVIRIIENRSLTRGSYTLPIQNSKDNQIYGIRMRYGSYDNTIWFYEN
jgi:hypothetical protein